VESVVWLIVGHIAGVSAMVKIPVVGTEGEHSQLAVEN